jgi:crotonobetainyl-CoA:carnitine CoA-transferase CaiB-like acyl-CoA transferase
MFGVIAVQSALRERDHTDKGQRVSSSLFESAVFLMGSHMAGMVATGLDARPMPARRGAWAVYDVFNTRDDGQLFIGVTSDQQWERFVLEFNLQGLAADPRLDTNVKRLAERTWLLPALQDSLIKYTQKELEERCEHCNISWAPVGQPKDLFEDPHLLATGGLVDVFISKFGEDIGKMTGLPALPVEFGAERKRPKVRLQPPKIGEHNEEILLQYGFKKEEIQHLYKSNILTDHTRMKSQSD